MKTIVPFVLLCVACQPRQFNATPAQTTTETKWPFRFVAQPATYHGFSWTSSHIPDGAGLRFIEAGCRQAHEENQATGGHFPQNMVAGNGLYFAQDPFVSYTYGTTLVAVTLKPGTESAMAHASEADYPEGPAKHYIPVMLSPAPVFHYFWRNGIAFTLRNASAAQKVDVFETTGIPLKPFADLPAVSSLSHETLARFFKDYGPWVRALAALPDFRDYRQWTPEQVLEDDQLKILAAWQKNGAEPAWEDISALTPQDVAAFATPEVTSKANMVYAAMMSFRQQLDSTWSQTWKEVSESPLLACSRLSRTPSDAEPLYGYGREDMDSPRLRSFTYYEGTHTAAVKSRRGDVVHVTTEDGSEGFTYLTDWQCAP